MCGREALGAYLQLSHKVHTFSHCYSAVLFKEERVQRQEVKIKTDLDGEHADEKQIQFYYYKFKSLYDVLIHQEDCMSASAK